MKEKMENKNIMISALLIGRKGSIGFPGKNTYLILGKPMAYYPMNAAKKSHYVDIRIRSGLAFKGLMLANGAGVADLDFENEIILIVPQSTQCGAFGQIGRSSAAITCHRIGLIHA